MFTVPLLLLRGGANWNSIHQNHSLKLRSLKIAASWTKVSQEHRCSYYTKRNFLNNTGLSKGVTLTKNCCGVITNNFVPMYYIISYEYDSKEAWKVQNSNNKQFLTTRNSRLASFRRENKSHFLFWGREVLYRELIDFFLLLKSLQQRQQ